MIPTELLVPIVIEATCLRWGHSRAFKCLRMKQGPPWVMKFIGNDGKPDWGAGMFIDLIEKGYTFSVETKFMDKSAIEMADIIHDARTR